MKIMRLKIHETIRKCMYGEKAESETFEIDTSEEVVVDTLSVKKSS